MDTGLLILRVVVGLLIAGHGVQKVSHRLGGDGLVGGAAEFRRDGFRGGRLTALAAGAGQVGSGLFLALGALTPAAAMVAMGVMAVAITVKLPHGLWVQDDGYEYPLVLVVVAGSLALTGPGRWSVDHAVGLTARPLLLSVAAVVLGPASGLLTRAVLHRPPTTGEAADGARPAG